MKKQDKDLDYRNCGIYMVTNKISGKSYIGKSHDLKTRKSNFFNFNRDYAGVYINNARQKYNSAEYWDYEILEYCSPDKLDEKEKMYIYFFNTFNPDLGYNLSLGGEGCRCFPIYQIDAKTNEIIREWESASVIERELGIDSSGISKCCRGERHTVGGYRWCYTNNVFAPKKKYVWSEQARKNKSRENCFLYKKHHTEEFKKKISDKLKGRRCASGPRNPKKDYTIRQYDLETNEFLNEFESIAEASRQTNVCKNGIRLNLKNVYTQAGGYRWEYGSPIKRPCYVKPDKAIIQLNENGEIINEWEQVKLAEEALGICHQTITSICKGSRPTTRTGLILRFKEGYNPNEKIEQLPKIIVQVDENDNIIKEWLSVKAAAKDLNITPSTIFRYLTGKIKNSRNGVRIRYKYNVNENETN